MPGPPRKPTQLKIVQGTARADRINAREPMPEPSSGKMPRWVSGKGRATWRRLAPLLTKTNVLTASDEDALALGVDSYAEFLECRDIVLDEGRTYTTVNRAGEKQIKARPEVAMMQDAWRRTCLMMQQFGLTPASRAKIEAAPIDKADPLDEFFTGLG